METIQIVYGIRSKSTETALKAALLRGEIGHVQATDEIWMKRYDDTYRRIFSSNFDLSLVNPSEILATDASRNLISIAYTGSGNVVRAVSPVLTTPNIGAASGSTLTLSTRLVVNTLAGNQVALNSSGSNIGFISNPAADTWALSYGTAVGTLGTSVLTWNASGLILIPGTLGVTGVATFTAAPIFSSVTASQILSVNGSKQLTSLATTGSGSVVLATSPTLTGTISGAALALSSSLTFSGAGSGADWSIWRSAGAGLSIRGGAGSLYDFALFNPAGQYLIRNPTGTQGVEFPGSGTYAFTGPITSVANLYIPTDGAGLFLGAAGVFTYGMFRDASNVLNFRAGSSTSRLTCDASGNWSFATPVSMSSTLGVTGVATFTAAPVFSSVTASQILSVNGSKALVSIATIGTGSVVLATSTTLTSPTIATSLIASYATASTAAAFDASKNLISVTNTGTGNNVLATSPTLTTPDIGAATGASLVLSAGATLGSDLIFTQTGLIVRSNSSDGSDSKGLFLTGGGAYDAVSGTRGACIVLTGNEYSGANGAVQISAGNTATSRIAIQMASNVSGALTIFDRAGNEYVEADTDLGIFGVMVDLGFGGTRVSASALPSTSGQDCPDTSATPLYMKVKYWNGSSWESFWLNAVPNKVIP